MNTTAAIISRTAVRELAKELDSWAIRCGEDAGLATHNGDTETAARLRTKAYAYGVAADKVWSLLKAAETA